MSKFIRVREKASGHEFTIAARTFDPEHQEQLDKPAVDDITGQPLASKPHRNVEEAGEARDRARRRPTSSRAKRHKPKSSAAPAGGETADSTEPATTAEES